VPKTLKSNYKILPCKFVTDQIRLCENLYIIKVIPVMWTGCLCFVFLQNIIFVMCAGIH